ncbi:hypothetical protein SPRG_00038 [Saprolegnia parasitica CBS 223.65]|uniref:SGNH hydrolase-type esterase domain-containing protein n=1 Tax=Saprolegnia parasitica (strain CBS 223.65) TaxID=695850 RepID=A0A067D878_SAPPC|nr:hypothetical protein SPRG_00038 [Saprolegnia parasitica CBS 223.65]KDO35192.1 hypothetical protein SPRG_00038 [Saprolegnia parasitica CBS 223.65]|eukprot:XP_012193544.1 hypothetical protein SPRG_00038 [Saprolegnia parasitica CBS 223.65]
MSEHSTAPAQPKTKKAHRYHRYHIAVAGLATVSFALGTAAGAAVLACLTTSSTTAAAANCTVNGTAAPALNGSILPTSLRPVILMVGDSIIEQAAGVSLHGFQALLSKDYIHRADVINSGRSAWTTRSWLPTVPALVQEWAARPPSLVIIGLGTNDARLPNATNDVPPDEYKANLEAMVHLFLDAFPATKLLLLTPAVTDDDIFVDRAYLNARVGEYANYCTQVGRRLDIPVINFWTLLQGAQKTVLSDGLHLSLAGNEFYHNQILAAIATSYPQLTPRALPGRP